MENLRAIVYVSTATRPMSDDELEALLVQARDLNLQSGVTGLLLHADGNFMQYFEGAGTGFHEVWARIRTSRRHVDIVELMNDPIQTRAFATWQMAFSKARTAELLELRTAQWQPALEAGQGASAGLELLHQFSRNSR